ncbi:MAG TPA: hypothetical protein VIH86_14335 [Puia sp.]
MHLSKNLTRVVLKFKNIFRVLVVLLLSTKANSQCPKSDAWIGGRLSGDFTKIVFQNQDHINADRFCSGINRETSIDSFYVMIIRDTTIIFKFKNIGQMFKNDLKNVIKTVEVYDKILFYDIWGTDYDGTKIFLNPLEYRLTEF